METSTNFDDVRLILREIAQSQKETDRITKQNAKLIGDLGNKFGSFTEGMAFPSMERLSRNKFGMTTVATRYKTKRGAETMEIDVLGFANGDINATVVVDVKSHLKERDIEQLLKIMNRFADFHPERKGKKLYGILAYVDGTDELKEKVMEAGLFVACIHDEVFELKTPAYFVPRDFSRNMVE